MRGGSPLGVQRTSPTTLRASLWLPGLPALLRLLFVFFAAASPAHALPSRGSGLHEGGGGGGLLHGQQPNSAADAAAPRGEGRQDGLDVPEPDPLPPAPSEHLLARMYRRNLAFSYDYPFWNRTDLDAEACRQLAINETAAKRTSDADAACITNYRCDFDRLRYPHWLVMLATCSRGPGRCYPDGRQEDEWRYSCFPNQEDILLLRYVDFSRTTPNRRSTGGAAASAAGGGDLLDHEEEEEDKADEVVESEEKGEWQLWFYRIHAQCLCYE